MQETLAPFLVMHFTTLKSVFGAYCVFIEKVLPRAFTEQNSAEFSAKVFERLLMYHEPVLFNRIQSSVSGLGSKLSRWFFTGLACCLEIPHLLSVWESVLKEHSAVFFYFFAVVLLRKYTDEIIDKKKREINREFRLKSTESLKELSKEAVYLMESTPESFKTLIRKLVISQRVPSQRVLAALEQTVVLPTDSQDLDNNKKSLFVVDLRSHKDFKAAHFSRCFNLPSELVLSTGTYR